MLLAIDIGNTNITLGLFKGSRLISRYLIATNERNYSFRLKKILRNKKIKDSIICSVVPEAARRLSIDLEKIMGSKAYIIGKDIKVPIRNLYRKPNQVGQDRLVNAYAGLLLYGAPLVVVDFGTAITFDVISKDKAYLGGMILPGLLISLEALSSRTALLPKIRLGEPVEFIGRDTKNSMLSGIVYGFAGLADNLVMKIKEKIGKDTIVAGTGGNIGLIGKYSRTIKKINPDLTLVGINFIYQNYFKKNT